MKTDRVNSDLASADLASADSASDLANASATDLANELAGTREPRHFDIVVVGAGPIGLAGGMAFAREGLSVAVVGPTQAPPAPGRTTALLDGSVRFLSAIGAWDEDTLGQSPLAELGIIDDTGSLFRIPPVIFRAGELDLPAFGYNVENKDLVAFLMDKAARDPGLTLIPRLATEFHAGDGDASATVIQDDGSAVQARLVVAADGRHSRMRAEAGITCHERAYPQVAITAILNHDRPHRDRSTEFHTRQGPFTLVPLPGNRSSLVWVCADKEAEALQTLDAAAFGRAVERQAQSMLGAMWPEGERGAFPLTMLTADRLFSQRLALVGETAHVLPPIGAQGLNLGLRDIAALRDIIMEARRRGDDIGAAATLALYARDRRADIALRTGAIDLMNRSLMTDLLPVDGLRGAALLALASVTPIRRLAMREGLRPSLLPSRLARMTSKAGL
ncbi:2-octaprenyl-6-methoxyphenol hydroxylase [Hyphomicrobiales bacterium]|nr:2-octaprenyl-6-methoxyphenol hydroxylase [Hyphomicrobiales bacterium]CAH1665236.1 2-octaprenyl-6-methoxyphenol hydroxylase [Hyphomicrobiales bacterium]